MRRENATQSVGEGTSAHIRKKSALPITEKGTLDGLKSGHTKKHHREFCDVVFL